MYYRIYLRFNLISLHLWNISGICLQSASGSYANAYVNVFQRLCLQRMFAWYDALLILRITQVWNTSNSMKLKKNHIVSTRDGHFFANRIINTWNSLPDYIVTSPTVTCFKRQLKSLNFSLWFCFYCFVFFFHVYRAHVSVGVFLPLFPVDMSVFLTIVYCIM